MDRAFQSAYPRPETMVLPVWILAESLANWNVEKQQVVAELQ
jgi:hypothetical protein